MVYGKYITNLPRMQKISVGLFDSFFNDIITETKRIYFNLNKQDTADADYHLQCPYIYFARKCFHDLQLC